MLEKDTPVFCTFKSEIISIKDGTGVLDDRETNMMSLRWKVYFLHAQIPESEQVNLSPCAKCFAQPGAH